MGINIDVNVVTDNHMTRYYQLISSNIISMVTSQMYA